jgi:hypothetical protein
MIISPKKARLPYFQDGFEYRADPMLRRRSFWKMALDVLHLDDRRIDDHPERDRNAFKGHEVCC